MSTTAMYFLLVQYISSLVHFLVTTRILLDKPFLVLVTVVKLCSWDVVQAHIHTTTIPRRLQRLTGCVWNTPPGSTVDSIALVNTASSARHQVYRKITKFSRTSKARSFPHL